ncbi:MAG TPA: Wzz/FepE/Etk N-terminal domain-containing protein [Terriglobales bacterium]|nr:Wzz/FepE/Etk N-terminal domain-containing protein [Terriglobales bacterium]
MAQREEVELKPQTEEEPAVAAPGGEVQAPRFPDFLIVVARRKLFIVKFVGVAFLLAIIISLLLPKKYTADTRIMPPQQNQSMGAAAILNQLGPLASLAGKDLALRNPSDLYVSVLKSRTVADGLIDRFSLMKVYGTTHRSDAERKLAGNTEIVAGKEGVISVAVEDSDPQRAADLANAYADELTKLTKSLAVTEAGRRRLFFEREMKQASDDLANAEEALKETQERTGFIAPDPQSRAMITLASSFQAQVAVKSAEVQAMRSFAAPGNPDLVRAEQELAALQAQVAKLEGGSGKRAIGDVPLQNVPGAALEFARKYRDVIYYTTLYELLAKQYEAARIDEGRDSVVVQQLDKAVVPERRSWPRRTLVVVATTFLAFLLALIITYLRETMEKAKDDPQFSSRLQLFLFYLRQKSS